MAKFKVEVAHMVPAITFVEVEAENEEKAHLEALHGAENDLGFEMAQVIGLRDEDAERAELQAAMLKWAASDEDYPIIRVCGERYSIYLATDDKTGEPIRLQAQQSTPDPFDPPKMSWMTILEFPVTKGADGNLVASD